MTPQFLSLELCQKLSSLAPGFEGHWKYTEITKCGCKICNYNNINPHIQVLCEQMIAILDDDENQEENKIICPAWQVEDLLRNLRNFPPLDSLNRDVMKELIEYLVYFPDTAYQKIEEYLWGILK